MNNDFRSGFEKTADVGKVLINTRGASLTPEQKSSLEASADQQIHKIRGSRSKLSGALLGSFTGSVLGELGSTFTKKIHPAIGVLGGAALGGGLGYYAGKKHHEKTPMARNKYFYE